MNSETMMLPIEGMTCASCSGRVQSALDQVDGVTQIYVNLTTECASVVVQSDLVEASDLVDAVRSAGYDVPLEKVTLLIGGMMCVSCVAHVEGALRDTLGVAEANVNLATEKVAVTYIRGAADLSDFREAVGRAGYELLDTPADFEVDEEVETERKMQ